MRRLGLLGLVVLLAVASLAAQKRFRFVAASGGGSADTLTIADLSNCKMWLGPEFGVGTTFIGQPTAMDHDENGDRRYFTANGDGGIYSFIEPSEGSMSPCSTAIGSLTPVSNGALTSWGTVPGVHTSATDAGEITYTNSNAGSAYAFGLFVLESTTPHTLGWGWTGTYTGVNPYEGLNSLALVTLNEGSHSLSSLYGCYALSGIRQNYAASQILDIPSEFVSANGLGTKTWAAGTGFATTSAAFYAMGPHLYAITPPSSNACASGTDYPQSFTTLSAYYANGVGPSCHPSGGAASGPQLGCAENQRIGAPTNPLPALTNFLHLNSDNYIESWDAYEGVGYYAAFTNWRLAWYHDDRPKAGMVSFIEMPHGFVNTTITAVNSSTSITLSSVCGDRDCSTNINPGDWIYVQVCALDVDILNGVTCTSAGATANGNHLEKVQVSTVNTGTKVVTFSTSAAGTEGCGYDTDTMTGGVQCGWTDPIVGGYVYGGAPYIHGAPNAWRKHFRLQIIPEQEYADVLDGAPVYSPTYSEDVGVVAQWGLNAIGDPSLGSGAKGGGGDNETKVAGVFVDNADRKIILSVHYHLGSGVMRHLYYRFDVD